MNITPGKTARHAQRELPLQSLSLGARHPRKTLAEASPSHPATLVPMASWTDGAAYAPIERPDGFALPDVAPLPAAEPAPQLTPGAVAPPSGFAPMSPAVALEDLGKEERLRRNPAAPFDVSSALMMAYAAGYGSRDPRQPFVVTAIGGAPPKPLPPDPTSRLNLPTGPYQPIQTAPYPHYGTGPIPMTQAQRSIMCVAGIASILGVLLPQVLPWLLLGGGGLLLRTNKSGRQIGIASLIIGAMLVLVLIAQAQDVLNGLGRWFGLAFGIACLATAFSSPAQR